MQSTTAPPKTEIVRDNTESKKKMPGENIMTNKFMGAFFTRTPTQHEHCSQVTSEQKLINRAFVLI
jgi:hypothetical protein